MHQLRPVISQYGIGNIIISFDARIEQVTGIGKTTIDVIVSKDIVMVDILGIKIQQHLRPINDILFKVRDMYEAKATDDALLNDLEHALTMMESYINYTLSRRYSVMMGEQHEYTKTGEIAIVGDMTVLHIGKMNLLVDDSLREFVGKKVPIAGIDYQLSYSYAMAYCNNTLSHPLG